MSKPGTESQIYRLLLLFTLGGLLVIMFIHFFEYRSPRYKQAFPQHMAAPIIPPPASSRPMTSTPKAPPAPTKFSST